MATKATYVGETRTVQEGDEERKEPVEFLAGIPARDLEDADWDALSEEQQEAVTASPLYRVRGTKAAAAPAPEAPEGSPAP